MADWKLKSDVRSLPTDQRPGNAGFARAVGAYVPKVTAAVFERYGFHSAAIMTSWETIVGAELSRLAKPDAIRWPRGNPSRGDAGDEWHGGQGATLQVACDPSFALDVSYRGQEIVDCINRYFGYRAIAKMVVRQMPSAAQPVTAKDAHRPSIDIVVRRKTPATAAGNDLDGALGALQNSIASTSRGR